MDSTWVNKTIAIENTDRDEDSEEDSDSEEALPTNYESDAISTDVSSRNKDSDSLATECERLKKELEETQAKLKAAEFRIDALNHDEKQYTTTLALNRTNCSKYV